MNVTYLNHSGFLLEWENCYWIFDYYKGKIPRLNTQKEIFVFSSHSHEDHFNPIIFALAKTYPKVTYILSNEIKRVYGRYARNPKGIQLSAKQIKHVCAVEKDQEKTCMVPVPEVQFLRSRNQMELLDHQGNVLQIYGLQSTDCGCAFFITYMGRTVYHAGDLHWWYWSGESESFNKKMTADYKKEMEYLAGKAVDLVFTPLDPRQGAEYALGMNYILQQAKVKHVFPMHFWNDSSVCVKYQKEYTVPEVTTFYAIEKDGQSWELEF